MNPLMLDVLCFFLAIFTVVSWIFWLITLYLAYIFFVRSYEESKQDFLPPVSILIPVKGLDYGATENIASFCQQDYPEYELVIGVFDRQDPAVPVIEALVGRFPESKIRLYIVEPPGLNRKAAMLHYLAAQARYPLIVTVDSDMRATPDYLSRVIAPLADKQVGLVTCTYHGIEPRSFSAKLETLHMGASFLPLVMVARQFLSMRFAMGATMALRRSDLERMGGFAAVSDYLADDYQVGERIAGLGLRVHLSKYVIACALGKTSLSDFWQRQIRFARTNRVCRPFEYPGQLIYFSTPLALTWFILSGFTPVAFDALVISMLLRWWVAWAISGWTDNSEMRRWLLILPVQDGLSALVWVAGLFGSHVVWRGRKVRIFEDGRIMPADYVASAVRDRED